QFKGVRLPHSQSRSRLARCEGLFASRLLVEHRLTSRKLDGPARTTGAGPFLRTLLIFKLYTGRCRRGYVQARRREHAAVLVYFKRHDICRILIANVYEVASRIEIEMPRRAPLRVNPTNHGQLRV